MGRGKDKADHVEKGRGLGDRIAASFYSLLEIVGVAVGYAATGTAITAAYLLALRRKILAQLKKRKRQ